METLNLEDVLAGLEDAVKQAAERGYHKTIVHETITQPVIYTSRREEKDGITYLLFSLAEDVMFFYEQEDVIKNACYEYLLLQHTEEEQKWITQHVGMGVLCTWEGVDDE